MLPKALASEIMCRLRNPKASALHYKISAALFHSSTKHENLVRMNCLAVSVRKVKVFVNSLRTPQKFKFFDRHMSQIFDLPSQSRAPFAGNWRFSKSRGLMINVNDHFTKTVQKVNLTIKNRFAVCTCLAYN